jgi:hypothetical protein
VSLLFCGGHQLSGLTANSLYVDFMSTWLYQQFSVTGPWNYKVQQTLWPANVGTTKLQKFGNFNYGAVLEALGMNQYFTQNAAGIYQMLRIGKYTQGFPVITWPYGDSVGDANVIQQGWLYEAAALCRH